ncbi:MAG: hypothetical protein AAFR61_13020 [Bacteroidota bacterium]
MKRLFPLLLLIPFLTSACDEIGTFPSLVFDYDLRFPYTIEEGTFTDREAVLTSGVVDLNILEDLEDQGFPKIESASLKSLSLSIVDAKTITFDVVDSVAVELLLDGNQYEVASSYQQPEFEGKDLVLDIVADAFTMDKFINHDQAELRLHVFTNADINEKVELLATGVISVVSAKPDGD